VTPQLLVANFESIGDGATFIFAKLKTAKRRQRFWCKAGLKRDRVRRVLK
jgi:hypothetical protein